jgi:hypothetical protein
MAGEVTPVGTGRGRCAASPPGGDRSSARGWGPIDRGQDSRERGGGWAWAPPATATIRSPARATHPLRARSPSCRQGLRRAPPPPVDRLDARRAECRQQPGRRGGLERAQLADRLLRGDPARPRRTRRQREHAVRVRGPAPGSSEQATRRRRAAGPTEPRSMVMCGSSCGSCWPGTRPAGRSGLCRNDHDRGSGPRRAADTRLRPPGAPSQRVPASGRAPGAGSPGWPSARAAVDEGAESRVGWTRRRTAPRRQDAADEPAVPSASVDRGARASGTGAQSPRGRFSCASGSGPRGGPRVIPVVP